ncbi:MAG: 23S rRNA (pseudouridine(1915)-N(3))-methyltransferase RlmH [Burkholderiales bacterium]
MKLRIVALGHRMPAWVDAGYAEYARRIDLDLVELKPEPRAQGKPVAQLLAAEAARIRAACAGYLMVVLDERGKPWSTRELAAKLARWKDEAQYVAFVIGSADGLDPLLKREAAATVALSSFTLPHGLVRVMMAEQLYRAASVNAGHPYHRE